MRCSVLDEAQTRDVTKSDEGAASGLGSISRSSSSGVTRVSSERSDVEGEEGDAAGEGGNE